MIEACKFDLRKKMKRQPFSDSAGTFEYSRAALLAMALD
jgi:hypothetical protein